MLITAMEPRRGRRTALFLDGELAVTLDAETLLAHGWKIGREITDEELHEMIERSESRRAGEKALICWSTATIPKRSWRIRLRAQPPEAPHRRLLNIWRSWGW